MTPEENNPTDGATHWSHKTSGCIFNFKLWLDQSTQTAVSLEFDWSVASNSATLDSRHKLKRRR
ncbi:hypothetical protein EYF80_029100 [Liparis tanakae]|uniref:Uncharacterized protein n=1 Tax=Liparis tanakae TaxID=230148 RepID=A0A4Z2H439_9TELE|nr:hypothetical protein EYF80_029100 [Liparis tanakae]